MARHIITGIDIGTHTTRVVVTEYVPGKPFPRILGIGWAESKGLKHGYIVNNQEAAKSIIRAVRAAERSSQIKIKRAMLSVGGVSVESEVTSGTVVVTRADGEITQDDVIKAMTLCEESALGRNNNRRVIYSIPIQYKLDNKEVLGRPQGMKGSKLEVKALVVTCLEQHLEDLINAVEETGVLVEDIAPAPLAASHVALTAKQRMVGGALANIGAETVSIVVFEDGSPISLQVFPIGGTAITNDIALGFRIPLEEAERLKLEGPGSYPRKKLEEIIEARLSDIFELIEAHLKKIGRSGLLPAGIIITGGGAGIEAIDEFARISLKLPSQIASPAILNASDKIRDSSWFVAYGLSLYRIEEASRDAGENFGQTFKNVASRIGEWFKQFLP